MIVFGAHVISPAVAIAMCCAIAAGCQSASAAASTRPSQHVHEWGMLPSQAYVPTCARHGAGFFAIPGAMSCLRIGGMARMDLEATTPLPVGVKDRLGYSVLGRISVDARAPTDWGVLRTYVRIGLQSLTGRSFSGAMSRHAAGFGATGVDTWEMAQKGVILDRAFVQFGSLSAGRAASFYDFYAHDVELAGVTPVSDPQPVNFLAWTFKAGGGVSLTVAMEDPTSRRTPVAFSRMRLPDGSFSGGRAAMLAGAVPVAEIYAGFDAQGRRRSWLVDTRQRLNVPDAVGALRLDADWGAAQLSGALHQVNVGPILASHTSPSGGSTTVAGLPSEPGFVARRPATRYGYAAQAGVMLKLPMLGDGDQLWAQIAAARGAVSYTGANAPAGQDNLSGSAFGRISAHIAEAWVGPAGQLQLSSSWSALLAFEHFWRPDLSQSVFAGMSGVDYGAAARLEGSGRLGRMLAGHQLRAAGTRLAWAPLANMTIAAEVAWARLQTHKPTGDLRRDAYAPCSTDSGWFGVLRVERSF